MDTFQMYIINVIKGSTRALKLFKLTEYLHEIAFYTYGN